MILETLDTYRINLKSLSIATDYEFNYTLGDDFFGRMDGAEARQGNVNVSLSIAHTTSSTFEMTFHSKGTVIVTCDRCLDDMEVPIDTTNRLIVTFGETYEELTDEYIVIPEEEGYIDTAWYMYEFIALAIPIKHVHEAGECDEAMMAKLAELCVNEVDKDDEETNGVEKTSVDPRWDALRILVKND